MKNKNQEIMTLERAYKIYMNNPKFVKMVDCHTNRYGKTYEVKHGKNGYGVFNSKETIMDGIDLLRERFIINDAMVEYWKGYYDPKSEWYSRKLYKLKLERMTKLDKDTLKEIVTSKPSIVLEAINKQHESKTCGEIIIEEFSTWLDWIDDYWQ